MKISIGFDHGAIALRAPVLEYLSAEGHEVIDHGTDSAESVDYPDFAYAVAIKVSSGEAWRGIIIDGAGIGSCMVANKVRGVRAAMCYDHATALNSREHNNANVISIGQRMVTPETAIQIVDLWLKSEFEGGRHERRVGKISLIEERSLPRDKC